MKYAEAYKKARFRAIEPEGDWPEEFGVVTACNPAGEPISERENAERTRQLEVLLLEAGRVIFPVTGYDPNSPHEEAGFGVVCGKDEILRLGRLWKQEAVFWIVKGKVWLLSCAPGGEEVPMPPFAEMLGMPACPYCGLAMKSGTATLQYTLGGFLFAGVSWLTLFFQKKGQKRIPVFGPSDKAKALFCKGCKTLVIQGELAKSRECGKCGRMVHPGRSKCSSCGEEFTPRPEMPSWVDY
ncbi:MAG: DUF3293 domain-containing protein [Luteolibacter sp.]